MEKIVFVCASSAINTQSHLIFWELFFLRVFMRFNSMNIVSTAFQNFWATNGLSLTQISDYMKLTTMKQISTFDLVWSIQLSLPLLAFENNLIRTVLPWTWTFPPQIWWRFDVVRRSLGCSKFECCSTPSIPYRWNIKMEVLPPHFLFSSSASEYSIRSFLGHVQQYYYEFGYPLQYNWKIVPTI